MKALPSNIGAEPKKLALLGAIVVGGLGLVYWANSGNDAPQQVAATAPVSAPVTAPAKVAPTATPSAPAPRTTSGTGTGPRVQTRGGTRSVQDFRPSIKPPEGVDISRVDPRLKTELLARLRALPEQASSRSIFEFYVPPAPPPPVQPIKPIQTTVVTPPPAPPKPTGPPPPPPIPLKYYGYAGSTGNRAQRGFFVDMQDNITVAAPNDMIANRYRIVRIGVSDAEVEDTVTKNRETIKLTPENDA